MTTEEQNVELARRLFAAFGARDAEAIREVVHPEGELKSVLVELEGDKQYRGHDGVERYLTDVDEVFEDWHTEDERFVAVGDDRVICIYRVLGHGKGSAVPVDTQMAIVWSVRDGMLDVGQVYADPQEAVSEAQAQ